MKSFCKYLTPPILVLAVVLSLILTAAPAMANPGLRVEGAILQADVAPGETITHTMRISLSDTDPAMDILVDIRGLGQSLDGSYQALEASDDITPYSARTFITLDKNSFHLEPGESQDVVATIHVPENVVAGGRYALIYVYSQPTGVGDVGVISAVAVTIALTIENSELTHQGEITLATTDEVVSGQPINIMTTFQNTGNHHFRIKERLTISNAEGEVIDVIHLPLTSSSVIPSMSRQLKAIYIPQGGLPPGVYSFVSTVMLEDDTVLDEVEGSFEAKETYISPLPDASVILAPNISATLETDDGRIYIMFPKGSVTSQVTVSVRNYYLEQLPEAPSGFEIATTCFRIDGLSGLLAQEATLTVQYAAADLERAGGDASRLRLARWDEADQKWSVLETKVDKEAGTLTTNTNQLSLHTIMIGPPSSGTSWWLLFIYIAAGVIVIGLLVYFLVIRRRRQPPKPPRQPKQRRTHPEVRMGRAGDEEKSILVVGAGGTVRRKSAKK